MGNGFFKGRGKQLHRKNLDYEIIILFRHAVLYISA